MLTLRAWPATEGEPCRRIKHQPTLGWNRTRRAVLLHNLTETPGKEYNERDGQDYDCDAGNRGSSFQSTAPLRLSLARQIGVVTEELFVRLVTHESINSVEP